MASSNNNHHSKTIWLMGHWLSQNMGDRYQPTIVAKYLSQYIDLSQVTFINFFPDITSMSTVVNNQTYPVVAPGDVNPSKARLIILVTGSINKDAAYMKWLPHYLQNKNLDRIIIWGGFTGIITPSSYKLGLEILADRRITFWARSWLDLNLYRDMFGRDGRGCLAGDPMAGWILLHNNDNNDKDHPTSPKILIPSIYAWRRYPEKWNQLIELFPRVISIDSHADQELFLKYPKIESVNDPEKIIPLLLTSSHVVSARLHSALLATLLNIPTTMVIHDDAMPGTASFKFEAIGGNGIGKGLPLCQTITGKELSDNIFSYTPDLERENNQKYLRLTEESFITIIRLVREYLE